jgi:hypothetical protein
MQFDHTQFTLGFRQALEYGIDYRDHEKVDRLPKPTTKTMKTRPADSRYE